MTVLEVLERGLEVIQRLIEEFGRWFSELARVVPELALMISIILLLFLLLLIGVTAKKKQCRKTSEELSMRGKGRGEKGISKKEIESVIKERRQKKSKKKKDVGEIKDTNIARAIRKTKRLIRRFTRNTVGRIVSAVKRKLWRGWSEERGSLVLGRPARLYRKVEKIVEKVYTNLLIELGKSDIRGEEIKGFRKTSTVEDTYVSDLALPSDIFELKMLTGELTALEYRGVMGAGVIILLDKSGSMALDEEDMKVSKSIAVGIVRAARKLGVKSTVFLFDWEVYGPFEDPKEIDKVLKEAIPLGGTNIQGALEAALEQMEKWKRERGKIEFKRIVLISDGESEFRIDHIKELIERCKKERIKIDVISMYNEENNFAILAKETGGITVTINKTENIEEEVKRAFVELTKKISFRT